MLKPTGKYFFICIVAALYCFHINAVGQTVIIPEDSLNDNAHAYKQLDEYKNYLAYIASQNTAKLDKKIQKQYYRVINEKNSSLLNQLKEKEFLFDTEIYPYLGSIFNSILEKNSLDKKQFHFFIDRTSSINAYTFEDGTVVCNLGLLNIIQNESQLAMVLCHELGHYLLNHFNSALVSRLQTNNSDKFLAQVKETKKERYNTIDKVQAVALTDIFDRSKHDRSQESAADSLGMLLFSKTNYGSNTIPTLFDLLDSSEHESPKITIQDFFKEEEITINENWFKPVKKENTTKVTKNELPDSLQTYPGYDTRKMAVESFFKQHPKSGLDFIIADTSKLLLIKNRALFDEANFTKGCDNLGYYLYQLIQNNSLFPCNKYIKTEIFNTLLSLCTHQKEHSLYMVVKPPYFPEDDKDEYSQLLKILDIINLHSLVEITAAYYEKNKNLIIASASSMNMFNQLNSIQ